MLIRGLFFLFLYVFVFGRWLRFITRALVPLFPSHLLPFFLPLSPSPQRVISTVAAWPRVLRCRNTEPTSKERLTTSPPPPQYMLRVGDAPVTAVQYALF